MKIKLNNYELETINLFPKLTKTFICSKCLKEKLFNNESFYLCTYCKTSDYLLCKDCYEDLYSNSKDQKDDDDFFKDFIMQDSSPNLDSNEKEQKFYEKIHEHPLLFLFNFNINKNTFIIKDLYDKYLDLLANDNKKKFNKADIKICSVCNNYLFEDSKNISVILSHIKVQNDFSYYSKPYEEIFICNECFQTNDYQNAILKEENDNNFVILRLLKD